MGHSLCIRGNRRNNSVLEHFYLRCNFVTQKPFQFHFLHCTFIFDKEGHFPHKKKFKFKSEKRREEKRREEKRREEKRRNSEFFRNKIYIGLYTVIPRLTSDPANEFFG